MSGAKFTPGPWKIVAMPHGRAHIGDAKNRIIAGQEIVWLVDNPQMETLPNLRLIAAAPELLSALEALEDYAGLKCIDLQSPAMVAARTAINKAKTGL